MLLPTKMTYQKILNVFVISNFSQRKKDSSNRVFFFAKKDCITFSIMLSFSIVIKLSLRKDYFNGSK